MASLTSLKNQRFVAILYGKPKTGKTVFASQFPSPWFIDLDNGLGSVLTIKNEKGLDFDFDVTQLSFDEPTTDEDFIKLCGKSFARQDGWTKLKKVVEVLSRRLPQDATLIIDSISRASEFLIKWIQKTTGHKQLQIQDWGTFADEMLFFFNLILTPSGKCNTIIIGHESVTKDELTGAIERAILLPGKSASRLPSIVDEFWYMTCDVKGSKSNRQIKRILQTSNDRITNAGSRAWMPDIEEPSYEKVKPYLEKSLCRKMPESTWKF